MKKIFQILAWGAAGAVLAEICPAVIGSPFQWAFMCCGTWVAVAIGGSAILGAITSGEGISAQESENAATNASNAASISATNQSNWNNYLVSRGLATNGSTPTGTIPTTGTAVNTKLPLWANVVSSNGPSKWVKTGTAAPATTWSMPSSSPTAAAPGAAGGGAMGGASPGASGYANPGFTTQGAFAEPTAGSSEGGWLAAPLVGT